MSLTKITILNLFKLGFNAQCKKPEDCKIKNGACISYVCSCVENFIPVSEDNCVESKFRYNCIFRLKLNSFQQYWNIWLIRDFLFVLVSSYGNKCDYHIQCNAKLTNGICSRKNDTVEGENSTSGICTCASADHYNNGNCFAKKCEYLI